MNLLDKLNWRYATKRMNGETIAQQSLDNILEAIRLAPSSMGLQPYHCFVISDKELLQKIYDEACKQPQMLEASHVIVFAAWKDISAEKIDTYINNIAQTRGVGAETLNAFKDSITGAAQRPADQLFIWNARQSYIGLGFGLVAAANEAIDATPMEGFNNAAMDKILGLAEQGLSSVSILSLGYRDAENDYLVNAQKVRRAKEDFFTML